MKKIFISLIMIMLVISFISTISFAEDGVTVATQFSGKTPDGDTQNAAVNILGSILAVVRTVGVIIAVAILMIIGIKYIIASAGDRADIKKYAVKYIIGALILFAASGLITIAQNIINKSFGG